VTTGRYGEHDHEHYERPRRHTRPRTKERPSYDDAVDGVVVTVDRGRFTLLVDGSKVMAMKARPLGRKGVVVGDRVRVVGDTSGVDGSLARIVEVNERLTTLRRTADDDDPVERVIVANADQMMIVVSAANPEPRIRLVDRYLVAAFDARIQPLLCITKTDLADPGQFLENFAGLDLPVYRSSSDRMPLDEITRDLAGHRTVFVGHSGVGKSTLVNALVPGADRAIGRVNEVTGRGRHTSSSTISLRVEGDGGTGWVIDTPGVRSFGLGHVNPDNILGAFTDLARIAERCPRGCTHLPDAPDCALNEAVAAGELGDTGRARLDSLQRLLTTFA
jgi:ribosome biogenesis GTPase / thiamine phosphate phosphatase